MCGCGLALDAGREGEGFRELAGGREGFAAETEGVGGGNVGEGADFGGVVAEADGGAVFEGDAGAVVFDGDGGEEIGGCFNGDVGCL